MNIGDRIYQHRKRSGLSQEDLADKMQISRQSISLWETNQTTPSLASLITLAKIFNVSLDELCGVTSSAGEAVGNKEPLSPEKPDRIFDEPSSANTNACETVDAEELLYPDKSDCKASAQTKYTPELITHINTVTAKNIFLALLVAIVLTVMIAVSIAVSDANKLFLIIPALLFALFVALFVANGVIIDKRSTSFIIQNPNGVATASFFKDRLELQISSDKARSRLTVLYSEVTKVENTEKCVLIFYGNSVVPIAKGLPDTDYDTIFALLNIPNGDDALTPDKKVKRVLLSTFVASLLSVLLALIAVAIGIQFTPLPDYAYTFLEYMWIFYIFIPIPLASAVLGVVYCIKKRKGIKNIVAGVVMSAVLSVFGTFPFMFENYALHDFGYVYQIEEYLSIELPDSGYISRATHVSKTVRCMAMIKFDHPEEMNTTLYRHFSAYRGDGTDKIKGFNITIPDGYSYYMVDYVRGMRTDSGKYLYFALCYNTTNNVMFVVEFLY